jgi:hypothetical protein
VLQEPGLVGIDISVGINFTKCAAEYVTASDTVEMYFQITILSSISLTINTKEHTPSWAR